MQHQTIEAGINAHIKRWSSEDLFLVYENLQALEKAPAWDSICTLLLNARDAAQKGLIRGPVLEQAEYARMMGILEALDAVPRIPDIVQKEAERVKLQLAELEDQYQEST